MADSSQPPKGRSRLKQLVDEAESHLNKMCMTLTADAEHTDKFLIRGAIMEMEAANYRIENAFDKILLALNPEK